jgi:hypothetical protein
MSLVTFNVSIDTTDLNQVKSLCTFLENLSGQPAVAEEVKPTKKGKSAVPPVVETAAVVIPPTPVEEESTVKVETVRALLSKKVGNHRDGIKSKLTELGANNVSSLEVSKFGEFMDYLNDLA